jgi:putative membrane protein
MMHGFDFGSFGSFGWIGLILNLIITVGVIIGIIWLVVWLARKGISNNQGYSMTPQISPREILQTRYARGEITREQYQQMLEDVS